MNKPTKDWEIHRRWATPILIAWVSSLVAWHFLVYHYCPYIFNPHSFDPRVHQIITTEGDLINDPSDIADVDGYYSADKWRDPRTDAIYSAEHPSVVRGKRAERFARAIVTFLCGLPLLYVYRLRAQESGDQSSQFRELTRNGLLVCLLAGAISYFIPVVELVLSLGGSRFGE